MKKLEQKYYAKWMVLPALILFMVFFIIPNCASFVMGFTDWSLFFFDDPRGCGFDNFIRLFGAMNFWVAVKNTFYFAIVTVIGKNVFGFLLALLVQKQTRYNTFLRAAFFMPITISALVVAIIFVSIYNPTYGLLNKLLSAVGLESLTCDWLYTKGTSMNAICAMELWQQTGYTMCICLAGLQAIPNEYFEAARIDGASRWQQIRYITLPLMAQSFTVSIMLSIIAGIKVFAQVGLSVQELNRLTVEAAQAGFIPPEPGEEEPLRLPAGLREELLDYSRRRGVRTGPVFVTRTGKAVNRTNVSDSVRRLCREAQVAPEKGNPRCLRKLYLETQASIRDSLRLLAEQTYDQMLAAEQAMVGWGLNKGGSHAP